MKTTSLDQVAALVLIIGCLTLVGIGLDGEIKGILGLAAGYLFGIKAAGKIQHQ